MSEYNLIKLEIVEKNNYTYTLKDKNKFLYNMNLEILDIEDILKIGDLIYMNEKLLDKKYGGYSTSYTFGDLESIYGKKDISKDDIDVIKVVINKKEIYLKRLYG